MRGRVYVLKLLLRQVGEIRLVDGCMYVCVLLFYSLPMVQVMEYGGY